MLQQQTRVYPSQLRKLRENECRLFHFLVQKALLSCTAVALNDSQSQSHWYQTIESSSVSHLVKFVRNSMMNAQTHVKGKAFFERKHLSAVLSFEYQPDMTKSQRDSSE